MTVAAALVVTVAVLALVVAALASVDASVGHERHSAHTLAGLIVWGVFLGFAALVTILYLGAFG